MKQKQYHFLDKERLTKHRVRKKALGCRIRILRNLIVWCYDHAVATKQDKLSNIALWREIKDHAKRNFIWNEVNDLHRWPNSWEKLADPEQWRVLELTLDLVLINHQYNLEQAINYYRTLVPEPEITPIACLTCGYVSPFCCCN